MTQTDTTQSVDETKLEQLMGQMVGHMTGAALCFGVWLGDELGLYRALTEVETATADELADDVGCNQRLVREWLDGQVAGGLLTWDADSDRYGITPEATMALADDASPAFVARAMNAIGSVFIDLPKITDAFRGDGGLSWGDHHQCLFSGTEWFFRTGYRAELPNWIAALDGVTDALGIGRDRRRHRVRSRRVGRGHGAALPHRTHHRLRLPRNRRSTPHASVPTKPASASQATFTRRRRQELLGHVRPDLLLRLPARHG